MFNNLAAGIHVEMEAPVLTQALSRLTSSTRSYECYRALKSAILNLGLVPGITLDEVELASQLGVSKTPVREALFRLSGEGLIQFGGGKPRVADLSPIDIQQIYQARIIVESATVREITPKLSESNLAHLEHIVHEADDALRRDSYLEFLGLSEAFHSYLFDCSENPYLIACARNLLDQSNRVRAAIFRSEAAFKRHSLSRVGIANHQSIVSALRGRDADQAAELMATDIRIVLEHVDSPIIRGALHWLAEETQ